MTDKQSPAGKRQRNRPAAHDHEYSVTWDQGGARFDILRDGKRTAAFATDKSTAIGLALREARQEALPIGGTIIVTSIRNGTRIVEWDGL
jgi:hypothetical protein